MSIFLHCEKCGKKIEAPDNAAGKWGKCPACKAKVYVPDPAADEELKLAPIDETEEERKKRLMAETYKLTQDILSEREMPDGATVGPMPEFQADTEQLMKNIVAYLRNMADGELNQAEVYEKLIIPLGGKAEKVLDDIAISDIPEPELSDIPQQVLAGLIRNLRSKIAD